MVEFRSNQRRGLPVGHAITAPPLPCRRLPRPGRGGPRHGARRKGASGPRPGHRRRRQNGYGGKQIQKAVQPLFKVPPAGWRRRPSRPMPSRRPGHGSERSAIGPLPDASPSGLLRRASPAPPRPRQPRVAEARAPRWRRAVQELVGILQARRTRKLAHLRSPSRSFCLASFDRISARPLGSRVSAIFLASSKSLAATKP